MQSVVSNFRKAAAEFGFDFIEAPSLGEGITAFGYLPQYGGEKGAVVCPTDPTELADEKVVERCRRSGYFCSFLNIEVLIGEYDREYFRKMLDDRGRSEQG